ncbi:dTDP-4-dehydrorhamnose reductase [Massilia sp. Root418]|jgi:dTDP-4-dehydrorhamnose reductase|uniref:sugar nucleotide-binding protein n=1 Tax=Massilia sp. Root418 TaxID=1736532 RepID=UPI0006F88201|nr:sugar nucleotide-binding protein [Massilia sp. Root418]KQW93537.1 dTDP-4-dehydrorhamnose reductase [Massilia sp. Root418]
MNQKTTGDIRQDGEPPGLALWGGLEATVNRVREQYFNQMEYNGHAGRLSDLDRFASLGIQMLRYPVLWELIAPDGLASADWSLPDERLPALRDLGMQPIAGLMHHGSGPRHTSLVDPAFPQQLAEYAGAVAQRYPWLEYYTPVNEPCTTARFCGLYGVWYPHAKDDKVFLRALLNQCKGVVLSMQAIRAVNPRAKLVQTDDLGKTYSTPALTEWAAFYNERRWLAWDLLCGMVGPAHALWPYMLRNGVAPEELEWFQEQGCAPDIIGGDYYVTSERWLDHRAERYPAGLAGEHGFVDIEAARALATPTAGVGPLLREAWERYGLPLAVTEAHIDANREDQLRWFLEVWQGAQEQRREGVDVRAVTAWSLLGSFDWNCLVTECKGYYENGAFDLRAPSPRPTALAGLLRELATGRAPSSPILQGQGWWRRPGRLLCTPDRGGGLALLPAARATAQPTPQPILVSGAAGTLGSAFARICRERAIAVQLLTRQEMDIADPASVEAAIARYRPWAIINAGGYVRVHDAERDAGRCLRDNAQGPAVLAAACARHRLRLMNFSSDLVFDGSKGAPYVESDPVAPLNVYGRSKAEAERRVLEVYPEALLVRTSAFFGPWDRHNFVTLALEALAAGMPFSAADDLIVSPTYVPDLVQACLDLLIDQESGIWHLSNADALSWADLARRAAGLAGVDTATLAVLSGAALDMPAAQPRYSALGSERASLMPTLDDALQRYLTARQAGSSRPGAAQAAHYGA